MEKVEQKIIKLFEDGINYQLNNEENNKYEYSEENIIANHDEFISMLENKKGISIITGSNGIGKTYLLNLINSRFNKAKRKTLLLELKRYSKLSEIKKKILDKNEIVIFDGLDEINVNIIEEVINYIFKINNKKVIVSSRKDFLQKNNMLNTTNNVYEIMPIEECKVVEILKNKNIDNSDIEDIKSLLKIPRFLIYIIDNIEQINNLEKVNKYNILNLIVNNHLDTLNNRANTKIEKNIHKKILQSMALVMMMSGKINLTIEEFTTFLSRINYLDIKNYIMNKDIIESFLNNQLLLNDGEILQFENKELLEFLAANEIIENNFSNSNLYKIVINENKEIDPFWFNTISYIVCESEVYRKLILEFVYNNIEKQDNLLNLLFNINFETADKEYIVKICQKMIFQYTKLYQYLSYNDSYISNIIRINYKSVLEECSNILININFNSKIDEFYTIYINNILSIIDNILDNYVPDELIELSNLKYFLTINEEKIMNDNRFKVRFLTIYVKIMDISKIDNVLDLYIINNRLLSIILHECKMINKLEKLDDIINTYILNYKDRFKEEIYFYMDDTLIKEFIIKNYNINRIKKLLRQLNSDKDVASFLRFINNNVDILDKFGRKTIVEILNTKIVKRFLEEDSKSNMDLREEIMFERRKGDAFEKIIDLCIKYKYISVKDLTYINLSNYIIEYICELMIKKLLDNNSIQSIYDALTKKELIFYVWKNDISKERKNKYENEIKNLFPDLYKDYIFMITKMKNKDYIDTENSLKNILEAKNIYYIINKMYDLTKNDSKYKLIISDIIMKNIFKQIIDKINEYVSNLNVLKLQIKYDSKEKSYTLSHDFQYYSQAIYVLKKGNININKYNDKNIILLRDNNDELNVIYSDKEYISMINYLKNKASEGYIRFYLYQIIEKLKNKYINELYDMIMEWIDKYDFEEYEINQFLSVIYENINSIDKTKLRKISRFREYKTCQDLLILMNIESEITNRINYIKENLVYSGDMMSIEKKGNFEYSSGYYTNPLSKIDIKYIKYITDITEFAFKKYNEGDYFYFVKYILDMVTNFIKNNIKSPQIIPLIKKITSLERKNKNRYLFNICNSISTMKKADIKQLGSVLTELNSIMQNDFRKIYSYDELLNLVKEILEKEIFNDIERMNFFEIFRNNKEGKLNRLNEQTFQFLIGYELNRILNREGFNTKVIYESTGFDKKRNDIQLVSEGFIQNIVIETKLTENHDISNEDKIKEYINDTLKKYKLEFNSPKILFVLINQTRSYKNCINKIKLINNNNEDFVLPILIDLKSIFDSNK